MSASPKWQVQIKSLFQLGLEQTGLYGLYQFGLKSGQIARQTPIHAILPTESADLAFPWQVVSSQTLTAVQTGCEDTLRSEAEEILAGSFRCFGGPPRPIQLRPAVTPPHHWTIPTDEATQQDIKWFWEPARFGWAFILARAYARFGDERCVLAFWDRFEEFAADNPANAGPNWASAQEVALRLMAVSFAAGVFRGSLHSTPDRMKLLRGFIIAHAERIPVTLNYSRAQNNNHLLTEAAGLWTAARLLPDHPAARRWNALGQANFNRGIQKQVALDGTYAQHSTNYHRLMLHTALWICSLYQGKKPVEEIFTAPALSRLMAAVRWLKAQTDDETGIAPNYGHNDGANILPLACADFADLRPTLQAAGRIFLNMDLYPPGPWDESSQWLGYPHVEAHTANAILDSPSVLRLSSGQSWAVLRASRYHSRPAHADQLHVDLWFQGQPLTLDAGTYLYNAPPPWENALAGVSVHNTIQVDGMQPMTRAGRFLWLDWDQADLLRRDEAGGMLAAQRSGYRRIGVLHKRQLNSITAQEWLVVDHLLPAGRVTHSHSLRMHWLVADLPWAIEAGRLTLAHPAGEIQLSIDCEVEGTLTLDRCGQRLYGSGQPEPISGWHSPTYGVLQPALSFSFSCQSGLPLVIRSCWQLPGQASPISAGF